MDDPSDEPTGDRLRADATRPPDSGGPDGHEAPSGPGDDVSRPPAPRWVKVSAVVVLVVVALLVLARVIGGGEHGPGRHASEPAPWAAAVPGVRHPATASPHRGAPGAAAKRV